MGLARFLGVRAVITIVALIVAFIVYPHRTLNLGLRLAFKVGCVYNRFTTTPPPSPEYTTFRNIMTAMGGSGSVDTKLDELREKSKGFAMISPMGPNTKYEWVELGGVKALHLLTADEASEQHGNATVLFYIHGGGFSTFDAWTFGGFASAYARQYGSNAVVPEYRLLPDVTFAVIIDDLQNAYEGLLKNGTDASRIVVQGDSAGGGLAAHLFLRLKEKHIAYPAAFVFESPYTQFSTFKACMNHHDDWVLPPHYAQMAESIVAHEKDALTIDLSKPKLFEGMQRAYVLSGALECPGTQFVQFESALRNSGVNVTARSVEHMPHCHLFFFDWFPEAANSLDLVKVFVQDALHSARQEKNENEEIIF